MINIDKRTTEIIGEVGMMPGELKATLISHINECLEDIVGSKTIYWTASTVPTAKEVAAFTNSVKATFIYFMSLFLQFVNPYSNHLSHVRVICLVSFPGITGQDLCMHHTIPRAMCTCEQNGIRSS